MKKMIFCSLIAIVAGLSIFMISCLFNKGRSSMPLLQENEALTYCEILDNKGETVYACEGEGTCEITKWGHTLVCDGTKLHL